MYKRFLEKSGEDWKKRLVFLEILGEGAAAVSFLYKDSTTGQRLVVKQYKHTMASPEQEAVLREVAMLRQLDHADIPQYVDHFVEHIQGRPLLHLMYEYIDGWDIQEWLLEHRSSQEEILLIIDQLLCVVVYLQSLTPPVLHRDIKPSNVLLRASTNRVVLIDFGSSVDWIHRTFGATMNAGTLGYMAPEQITGEPCLASDVYSVGVLLLTLLTRRDPKTLLEGFSLRWRPVSKNIDPRVVEWLESALAVNLEQRFQHATEALMALRRLTKTLSEPLNMEESQWREAMFQFWKDSSEKVQLGHLSKWGVAVQGWRLFRHHLETAPTGDIGPVGELFRTTILRRSAQEESVERALFWALLRSEKGVPDSLEQIEHWKRQMEQLQLNRSNIPKWRWILRAMEKRTQLDLGANLKRIQASLYRECRYWLMLLNVDEETFVEHLNSGSVLLALIPCPVCLHEVDHCFFEMRRVPKHAFHDSYWISVTAVTQELYQVVMQDNPSANRGEQYPVERVTWYDALHFCNRLSNCLGLQTVYKLSNGRQNEFGEAQWTVTWNRQANGFRLLTHQEWKRAARANRLDEEQLLEESWSRENSGSQSQKVAQRRPNEWGLYDVLGNVAEWCWDGDDQSPKRRLIAGGAFRDQRNEMGVERQHFEQPVVSSLDLGFRIARNASS